MVGGVLLVFADVFGLVSLGFIPGALPNPQGRFLFPFEGSFLSSFFFFCFTGLKLTLSSTPFFYLPVEWQEVMKRFRPVRLSVGGVPPRKCLL